MIPLPPVIATGGGIILNAENRAQHYKKMAR